MSAISYPKNDGTYTLKVNRVSKIVAKEEVDVFWFRLTRKK